MMSQDLSISLHDQSFKVQLDARQRGPVTQDHKNEPGPHISSTQTPAQLRPKGAKSVKGEQSLERVTKQVIRTKEKIRYLLTFWGGLMSTQSHWPGASFQSMLFLVKDLTTTLSQSTCLKGSLLNFHASGVIILCQASQFCTWRTKRQSASLRSH